VLCALQLNDFFSLRKPKDAKAGLASGLKSMGTGVCAGVLGLIVAPIVGGCKEGAKGALCGLCAGEAALHSRRHPPQTHFTH
jgi:hypothetical protein